MINYQQKIFNKFHSTGLNLNSDSLDKHFNNIISTYDWNYKNLLPEDKKAAILDLGCGLGECLVWLEQLGYKNVSGADISQEMIDIARKQTKFKAEIISSIKEALIAKKNAYDLIFLNDVIEHLVKEEILEDLSYIKQALRKEGKLIIKTNNLAAITGARMRYSDFTHEVGFTEYSLRQVLLAAGFNQVEIRPFAMPLTSIFRYFRFIMQKYSNFCWKLRFWINFTPVPKIVEEMIFAVAKK